MTAWTVRIEPADEGRAAAASATLAALPLSYTRVERDAEVVVVSGHDGWVDRVRAAVHGGARGVIVTDPVPSIAAATLRDDPPAASIVLAEPWASSPVLRAVRERFPVEIHRTGLVDARTVEHPAGRDLRTVVFAQLRAVQSMGIEVASVEIAAETPSSILAVGRSVAGARIVLSVAHSTTADGTLDILLVGREETIRIDLPDGTTARPGRAVLASTDAAIEVPTSWQTAHRASWVALYNLLRSGAEIRLTQAFVDASGLLGTAGALDHPGDSPTG
ncbi:hypothetical protein [Herbiconiux ginsengi]|uniref:Uncharacterized protein n=1 Tax=Herbiconiux ginsengi TaxID=381665 RepID=A0A1H3K819_9MICO|nr:hypothetical protein [Herbiconiux ginsengi]SDY48039.1 hypothetical protein SAMN05216554_0452 [Herbiconiux ginsengi]